MGMIEDIKNCKSCAERREAMKKYMAEVGGWLTHPFAKQPPLPPGAHLTVTRMGFDGKPLVEPKLDKPPDTP
jgi:hypothetical protein